MNLEADSQRVKSQSGGRNTKHVIIVGGGIGGLSAGLRLAAHGVQVTLLERGERTGGKLRELMVGGVPIDSGPTVMTMPWVFDELLQELGTTLAEHITLERADRIARHVWSDGSSLDLFADLQRSAAAIATLADAAEARRFLEFSAEAKRIYDSLEHEFLRAQQTSMLGLTARFGLRRLPELARIRPYTGMWQALGRHFRDPRLQQLFGRYAGYCGASPFRAPATLMLVAHVEQQGVWLIKGGMYELVRALTQLLERAGATLRTGAAVARIDAPTGSAQGVTLASGERLAADAVICNADVAALAAGHLGPDVLRAAGAVKPKDRSMSAVTWSMQVPASDYPLLRHNVFFSADYRAEFADIFTAREAPAAPTVYVCAQDRDADSGACPVTAERLLLIMNAPATGDGASVSQGELQEWQTRTFAHLKQCGLRLEPTPDNSKMTTPQDFEQIFPGTGGALYGRASHGWRSAFLRPGARTRIKNLYLAGGSTHPGPGVPMAGLSGRAAAASVLADFGLISP